MPAVLIDERCFKEGRETRYRVYCPLGADLDFELCFANAGASHFGGVHVGAPNEHVLVSAPVKTKLLKHGAVLATERQIVKLIRSKRRLPTYYLNQDIPPEPCPLPEPLSGPLSGLDVEVGKVGALPSPRRLTAAGEPVEVPEPPDFPAFDPREESDFP